MKNLFHLPSIIGTLPNTLTNGTTADATQVMADLNFIVNQVNANAAPLANTALTNVNNNFTAVQSGTAASTAANFPIASQVQNQVFNTLTSTLGTNTLTARCSALPLTAYASGQVFTFIPSQTNTGPANITVDSAGSTIIFTGGATLSGGELVANVPTRIEHDGSKMNIIGPTIGTRITNSLSGDVSLNNTANYFDGPSVAQGTVGTWYVSGQVNLQDTAGAANFNGKLWDGTNLIASCFVVIRTGSDPGQLSLSGFITNPVGNLRISVKDNTSASGFIKFNASGLSKDSTITAIRIA